MAGRAGSKGRSINSQFTQCVPTPGIWVADCTYPAAVASSVVRK